MVPVALTVAGSDPSGGAGVQADLKTFHQHQVYGAAVIALLTVQNSCGVQQIQPLGAELVVAQLRAVLEDMPVAAMKTGALGEAEVVAAVAAECRRAGVRPIVDPVRASKNGSHLLSSDTRGPLLHDLLPQACLVTPNLDELAWLTGRELRTDEAIRKAGLCLLDSGVDAVLVKGGHRAGMPDDLFLSRGENYLFEGKRVTTRHTHGLGCTLSAAICANMAHGQGLADACRAAKAWLERALATADSPGRGRGAVNHLAHLS